MTLYESILVMAIRAREVMGAVVEEERMTCRKGWRMDGVSTVRTSVLVSLSTLEGRREEEKMEQHTSTSFQLAPQACKGRQKGIVLDALALLAAETPSCSPIGIVSGSSSSTERSKSGRGTSSSTASKDCRH
jgi:hypothetical protein